MKTTTTKKSFISIRERIFNMKAVHVGGDEEVKQRNSSGNGRGRKDTKEKDPVSRPIFCLLINSTYNGLIYC